jgi:hypothetical protein
MAVAEAAVVGDVGVSGVATIAGCAVTRTYSNLDYSDLDYRILQT